jgi:hypothetical protein
MCLVFCSQTAQFLFSDDIARLVCTSMMEHIQLYLYKLFLLKNFIISKIWLVDFDGGCGLWRGMIRGTYKKISQADVSVLLSSGTVEHVSWLLQTYCITAQIYLRMLTKNSMRRKAMVGKFRF